MALLAWLQDIAKRYPDGIPLLDPVTDMGIDDPTLVSAIQNMNELEQQLAKNPGKLALRPIVCTHTVHILITHCKS